MRGEARAAPGVARRDRRGRPAARRAEQPVRERRADPRRAGIRAALERRRVPCVAVSPLVAGRAVQGPADRMLARLAGGTTPAHVASCYAGLIDALVVDEADDVSPTSTSSRSSRARSCPTPSRGAASPRPRCRFPHEGRRRRRHRRSAARSRRGCTRPATTSSSARATRPARTRPRPSSASRARATPTPSAASTSSCSRRRPTRRVETARSLPLASRRC